MSTLTKLLGFRYFKWQRLLTLTLIVSAASFLFSFTALSLMGFHRGFTAYMGEGGDTIAVYNPKSGTPYTGLVPAYLAEKLTEVNGVLAASPEVIAPCILNGEAVFLRGIIPGGFIRLNALKIVEGIFLDWGDINSAAVGENAARRLRLRVGESILLLGVLSDRYVELQVKGIFHANSMLDDEILAPLHVGQWLRGADYNHVTLIRLKINRSAVTPSEIFKLIAAEASGEAQPSHPQQAPQENAAPWVRVRFRPEDISVEEASKYMVKYIEKYGVTRETLMTLSILIFLFSSLTIILASETVIAQHRREISVLRALGAPKKLLKIDVLLKLSPWILIASTVGMLAASLSLAVIQEYGYLQVLSHTVPFNFDPLVTPLNFILAFTLTSISILKSRVDDEPC